MNSPLPIRSPSSSLIGLVGWLVLAFAAATIGAIASVDAGSFYSQLERPAWAPPGWFFAPVWSVLYAMMGVAVWLVWKRRGFAGAGMALGLFCVQLTVNALWSWLFFAWRLGAMAFVDTLLLWALIVVTVIAFWKHSRPAAIILLPYMAWVTFASVLTYSVWQLNSELLG